MNTKDTDAGHVADAVRRMAAHYGLWLAEAVHQLGLEQALAAEREAGDRAMDILAFRLARALDLPAPKDAGTQITAADLLAGLPPQRLSALHDALAVSWLALDGVWFQAVEGLAADPETGMGQAKRVNDTCWSRFAPLEARRIMALEDIGENGGLDALARVLELRLYARINQWEITERSDTGLTFTMLRCRVQDARRRKGLTDYPCKSGGVVEYSSLANAVDPRIATTCLHCPPDPRPGGIDGPACSWRFELGDSN